jgi:HK97 gp10 family phage protein
MATFVYNQTFTSYLGRSPEVAKVLAKVGVMAVRSAKRLCPVDTGYLRSSINFKLGTDDHGHACYVGSDVVYAPYQEFGTWKMAAHPFLRPGVAEAIAAYGHSKGTP